MILDRQSIQLIKNIINRSSIKVQRIRSMAVVDDKITGFFWATDKGYYSFNLDREGKIDYRQQKTRRRF